MSKLAYALCASVTAAIIKPSTPSGAAALKNAPAMAPACQQSAGMPRPRARRRFPMAAILLLNSTTDPESAQGRQDNAHT